jgi:hypothetical protein
VAGLVALVLGVLIVVGAMVLPLLMQRPAQATARPLNPPITLRARAGCDGFFKTRVTLTWSPSSSTFADGYAIYRGESADGPFRKVELVEGRGVTSWVDAGLDTGNRYFYTIRATAGLRFSSYSVLTETNTPGFCL